MKAIVCTRYGAPDVLQLQEVEQPVPNDNEVLIKVHAATATTSGLSGRKGEPVFARLFTGLTRPQKNILGIEVAGKIEAVGKDVKLFKIGDQILGHTGLAFGLAVWIPLLMRNGASILSTAIACCTSPLIDPPKGNLFGASWSEA